MCDKWSNYYRTFCILWWSNNMENTSTMSAVLTVYINRTLTCVLKFNPTIRFESNEDVGRMIQVEKEAIYSGCSGDLKKSFPQYPIQNIEILGLWFGARGTISPQIVSLFNRFGLDESHLVGMAESVVIDSIKMIHHHIYASN